MKKIVKTILTVACFGLVSTSCVEEFNPQTSYVTAAQAAAAPGSYDNFVNAITSTLAGQFVYSGSDNRPYDFGYPGFYLTRDVMGQDVVYAYQNWFSSWYGSKNLGPSYAYSQLPWTYYYGWIDSCNKVISLGFAGKGEGEDPDADKVDGVGIAYCMRAMYYFDIARMFAQKTYAADKSSITVPIVTESTSLEQLANNPRATNEEMYAFILSDLDKAEKYLAGYNRKDVYTPDLSVAYGLKARVYLTMEDWANAAKYAKLAQQGYTQMTADEYTDWDTGFNSPNGAWMLACQYKADDPNITQNDADSSWGSMMIMEIEPYNCGCGYAANYGQAFFIDRHLYETIPATDCRKKCYIDFAIDDMDEASQLKALAQYSAHPDWLYGQHSIQSDYNGKIGGIELKFRPNGEEVGRNNQYIGFLVSVPMMRVEEMMLIEAEATGMQNEGEGIALLKKFAEKRDPSYEYGTHTDAYYNTSTSQFRNEVWWQRRVEFWGEGLATFDIKRLQKGIIRSYEGTNHPELYRWNVEHTPDWMNWCIVQTESNYNRALVNNPTPIPPTADSAPFVW